MHNTKIWDEIVSYIIQRSKPLIMKLSSVFMFASFEMVWKHVILAKYLPKTKLSSNQFFLQKPSLTHNGTNPRDNKLNDGQVLSSIHNEENGIFWQWLMQYTIRSTVNLPLPPLILALSIIISSRLFHAPSPPKIPSSLSTNWIISPILLTEIRS